MTACVVYVVVGAADLGSSEYAIGRGGVEQNPAQQMRGLRIGVQAATAGVGCWADAKLSKRHRNGARVLRVAVLTLKLGLAAHNVRQGR